MSVIKKILIANRGEIALRVIETCKKMGIETVTLYTDSEKEYPHSYLSTDSYCLGQGTLLETYLNIEKIIEVAKKFKVDAIHPGYGFLSESSEFAREIKNQDLFL